MENVIIAGSGCAGLAAATYAARAQLNPLVLDGGTPGGQIIVSDEVENYPGFPEGISGMELVQLFRKQAERFGTRFDAGEVEGVEQADGFLKITTGDKTLETKTLIIATGADARRIDVPGEEKFYGKGVSGCATCDGFFFRDKEVVVVGGGNTAIDDALFLTRFASKVTVIHRREYLRASPITVEKARAHEKIEWMIPYVVEEVLGQDEVTGIRIKNRETEDVVDFDCGGIFVAIGHDPATEPFKGLVDVDENGYIRIEAGSTRTNIEGIYACGDVCDPVYKQAVVAAGGGCMAALDAQHYLEELG